MIRRSPSRATVFAALCVLLIACGNSSPPAAPSTASPIGTGGTSGGSTGGGPVVLGKCGQALPAADTVLHIPNSGRKLTPLGRLTSVGNFPSGGRLSPDGRFYWSVSAGQGRNDVQIVNVASGAVAQVLPLPGSYGQMVFSADGTRAYVSGTPKGNSTPSGPTMGDDGDLIHVFQIDPGSGTATELAPLSLPATNGGSGRVNGFPPSTSLPAGPAGLALTPDGKTLVVALYNADQAAIIDTASGSASTIGTGAYPFAVGIERNGRYAYVSNAYDGTLSQIDLTTVGTTGAMATTISGLGGPTGDHNAQPQYVLPDPAHDQLYVAVTNHDGVAVVSTTSASVTKFIDLSRPEAFGTQPLALALTPDGNTLYVANAGENAIVEVALSARPGAAGHAALAVGDVVGKIPTADYTTDVQLTPDGCTLIWQAGRGAGAGPNPGYGAPPPWANSGAAPYGTYVPAMLIGRVGVLPTPTDQTFADDRAAVEVAQSPENSVPSPATTPVHGATQADGSFAASSQIKYVFYVVKENRTYDQIFGSDRRGDGEPSLQVLEDNCGASNTAFQGTDRKHPGCGTTPNAHALSRMFVLLDNFYEDSEVSTDGHVIASGAYATNYTLKSMHQDYSGRGRPANEPGVFPVTFPPNDFLFDQAVTQGVSFHNYGELAGGSAPGLSDDNRTTYAKVIANSDTESYPSDIILGCLNSQNAPNSPACTFDCGLNCQGSATLAQSRIDSFNRTFTAQIATCTSATVGTAACQVPQFNYLVMGNDHTNGTGDGVRDPLSLVADNDLGVGQLVQLLSASAIWPYTAIFVIEDDAQDGADHVDAHRAPALVIGPWVQHGGAVLHTRYDQWSVVRTIELILGLKPLSLFDALATPMYDAFGTTPDATAYTAVQPEKDLLAVCPCASGAMSASAGAKLARANAKLSDQLPWNRVDAVPQALSDRLLWQRVFGTTRPVPRPGPHASAAEHARATVALEALREHRSVAAALDRLPADD